MKTSLVELLSWKADQPDINVFDASDALPFVSGGRPNLMGHRDAFGTTECPGDQAHVLIPVEAFEAETTTRELSTNVRLSVLYSPDARGDLPRRLFLKMVNLDMEEEFFGPSEVNYYTRDYLGVPDAPLIRAYDAAYSDELRRYHVLLDDVSESHVPAYTKTPALEYGKALVEGLAVMHAHWWGRERLDRAGEQIPTLSQINRFVDLGRSGAHHILAACAGELKPHWPAVILELYDRHPAVMAERARDASGFTLIHGDVSGSNVLVPIEGSRPLYIIDRQPFDWGLTTWLGVYDVTYAIVHRWDPDIRRNLEVPLLRHYHQHLLTSQVTCAEVVSVSDIGSTQPPTIRTPWGDLQPVSMGKATNSVIRFVALPNRGASIAGRPVAYTPGSYSVAYTPTTNANRIRVGAALERAGLKDWVQRWGKSLKYKSLLWLGARLTRIPFSSRASPLPMVLLWIDKHEHVRQPRELRSTGWLHFRPRHGMVSPCCRALLATQIRARTPCMVA